MSYFNLYAPLNELGYGRLSRGLISGLKDNGIHQFFLSPIGNIEIENQEEAQYYNQHSKTFKWVREFPGIAIWHEFDLAKFSSKKLIAFPIFETTGFVQEAVNYLSQMDAIIVLSEWAKEIVERNIGSSVPVFVVPAAATVLSTDVINQTPKSKSFAFLMVGKYESRKSPIEAVQAYIQAFSNRSEDTKFILHVFNPFDPNFRNNMANVLKKVGMSIVPSSRTDLIVAVKGSCLVEVVCGRIPESKVFELYKHCHMGIFPAKAEGWNLPLMEAIQTGLPCIATDYSAHTEYLNKKFNYNEDLLLKEFQIAPAYDGIFFHGNRGDWALPNIGELADKMLYSYLNYAEVTEKFDNTLIKAEFTWQNMGGKFMKAIQQV